MIKQIFNTSLPLIVYNPTGVFDLKYFSNCAEAGALPVLDAELISDEDLLCHLDELAKSEFLFGIRISAARKNIIDKLNEHFISNCDTIVICYDYLDQLKSFN